MGRLDDILSFENKLSVEQFEDLKSSLKKFIDEKNIVLNICNTTDDIINMTIDYLNGDYDDINKNAVPFLAFSLLYFIIPSSMLKDIIGEKTILRSILVFSVSYYFINQELKKYRQFLENNKVTIKTEYGDIVYYRHRIREEQ